MASTTSSLWMNTSPVTLGGEAANTPTPTLRRSPSILTPRSFASPSKPAFGDHYGGGGLSIELKKIIGSTVSSVTGFDSLSHRSCFATCAGSTAVVYTLNENLSTSQRYFRARPNGAATANGSDTPGQAGTPDIRGRQNSSIRASNFGARGTASPATEFSNSPSRGSARQRTRAATCLSLSGDGKILAVGETGYVPRILFFSMNADDNEPPYSILSEHTFGVKCLAFSPDSRYLCSVGDIHDGYIFLWTINPRTGAPKLTASNKCTSFVQATAWMGSSIVTVGVRHVKLWRTDSLGPPSPSKRDKFRTDLVEAVPSSPSGSKTLPGRNCLLGSSLESIFTCVTAISDSKAIIGTDKGDLFLLDDNNTASTMNKLRSLGFPIRSVSTDPIREQVWVGGCSGELRKIPFSELVPITTVPTTDKMSRSSSFVSVRPPFDRTSRSSSFVSGSDSAITNEGPTAVAMGVVRDQLIMIDADHCINVYDATTNDEFLFHEAAVQKLRSHSSPVLGMFASHSNIPKKDWITTWDATGKLIFWSLEGEYQGTTTIELDQQIPGEENENNELKVLRALPAGEYCVSGDKSGVIRLLTGDDWQTAQFALKAHTGEVNDVVITVLDDRADLISTCSRDRTIQIYEKLDSGTHLIQTIEQHASSVNAVLFVENGHTLCSASSDRTVVIHSLAINDDLKAYLPTRILTTKQSPISMALWPYEDNLLAVTTMDKQLHEFDISTGFCHNTLRLSDDQVNSTLLLSSLSTRTVTASWGPARLLFGVSSTDKSVRVHDLDSGAVLVRDYGHSEGLTNVAIIEESKQDDDLRFVIGSTGLDGTVMLWEITNRPPSTEAPSPIVETPSSQQPLRRVLSKSAIAEFSRTLEASGMSPLPPTPSRNPSPNRHGGFLRKKPSKYSLNGVNSAKFFTPPSVRRANRSPSPPSPATATTANGTVKSRKSMVRVKSVGNFNELVYSADQLAKSMRTFRKKMTSSSDTLKTETLKDLEKELALTAKALGQNVRRRQSASEMNVGDLLDEYSDKLAQMVQEKVALGTLKEKRENRAASSENMKP